MPRLIKPLLFETIFGTYVVDELLGEGGAGRVYGGNSFDQAPIAVKLLAPDRASTDRRNRFKNEIAFLLGNKHPNIVTVVDYGVSISGVAAPFYVMRRYSCNLRDLMGEPLSTERAMRYTSRSACWFRFFNVLGIILTRSARSRKWLPCSDDHARYSGKRPFAVLDEHG